jgi:hypothetical protein
VPFDPLRGLRGLQLILAVTPNRYRATDARYLDHLTSPGGLSAADTHVVLAGQRQMWLDFSRERLRRFGYAFDTF